MLGSDALLHQDRLTLLERIFDRRGEVLRPGHFRDAEAGTAVRRLDEKGQAQGRNRLLRERVHILSDADEGVRCEFHIVQPAEVVLAGVFVERHGGDEGAAGGVRDAQHLEIALQEAGLARRAVLHDVHEIELDLLAQHADGEVGLVHLGLGALRERDPHRIRLPHRHEFPVAEAGENLVDVVFEFIDPGCGELAAAAGHLPLGRITAVDDGDGLVSGHRLRTVYSK